MDNGLEILREIGAQKIHNETHISREYVQSIIHGSFEGLNSVQLLGFISILEREYNVNLSDLKAKGREHFEEEDAKSEEPHKIFIVPNKKKTNSKIYIWMGILIFLSALYYTFVYLNSISTIADTLDNTKIKNAQKSMNVEVKVIDSNIEVVEDSNLTENSSTTITTLKDANTTKAEIVEVVPDVKEVTRTLKILPKHKVWAGYINIDTNQKYQKIFRKEFALDATKNWLLLFGMGSVNLEVNGEIKKFSSKQNMRFKYKDGNFTKITVTEFKSLNKGRKW